MGSYEQKKKKTSEVKLILFLRYFYLGRITNNKLSPNSLTFLHLLKKTMQISVELTLTPIQDNYEPAIIDFIKALRDCGLEVKENPLSTQIFGNYDEVMQVLQKEMKIALEAIDRGLLYIKIVKSNRAKYEPHF